ncbi:MAG: alpha-ketoacid dehydrogenase subunit beta [Dehalococcoidia bacterium]
MTAVDAQQAEGRRISFVQAVNEALRQEMERDPSVIVMGEDVAGGAGREEQGFTDAWGGVFRLTKGLLPQFGPDRVRDTPISEAGFIGAAVGAAATGLRPVAELMFVGFYGVCADQITNNAAKMHYMFGGKVKLPLTIITNTGTGAGAAAQHSETLYAVFTHFPGLKCVVPSDAYTAKGLMAAAIRDDDPVIIFLHKLLLGRTRAGLRPSSDWEVPQDSYVLPIGKANIVREGRDLTMIGIGYTTSLCLQVAQELESDGVEAEVVDLLSLSPLDEETVLSSVKKTRRVVIVDEDYPRCSIASDLSALAAEEAFDYLDAPPRRVTPPHAPVPYSLALESIYGPTKDQITAAARAVLE